MKNSLTNPTETSFLWVCLKDLDLNAQEIKTFSVNSQQPIVDMTDTLKTLQPHP